MPTQHRFEGPVLEELLDEVRGRFGVDADIVEANKVRRGGVGGFFAREGFEVVVEADESGETSGTPAASNASSGASSLLDLVDAVDDHPAPSSLVSPETVAALLARTAEPAVTDTPQPSAPTEPAGIAAVLQGLDELRERDVQDRSPAAATLSTEGDAFADVLARITGAGSADNLGSSVTVSEDEDEDDGGFRSYADAARRRRTPSAPSRAEAQAHPTPAPMPSGAPVPTADPGRDASATHGLRRRDAASALPESLDVDDLARLGLPPALLGRELRAADRLSVLLEIADSFPRARSLPSAGDGVIVLVGDRDGMERAVEWVQEELGLAPDTLMLATRSNGRVFPEERRLASHEDAAEVRRSWRRRRQPTLVAVDSPVSLAGTAWTWHLLDALEPSAVWGVTSAHRKPEDVVEWSELIGGVDALAVDGTAETSSPASVLTTGLPVALVDGHRATSARWAAMLDERLLAA